MHTDRLPRYPLAQLPTPLEPLTALSKFLGGPRLLIKRDDQTGLALGGNKTRKLEFLLAEALAQGADTVITAGAAQSNHCRQTAAAAARAGLRCELVLGGQPPEPQQPPNGNLLLDEILGAKVHWSGQERRDERLAEVARRLRAQGYHPYTIPYGGSNAVGATGYVKAMEELAAQLVASRERVDRIIFASSSGGTQAGLMVGAKATGFAGQVLGIRIDNKDPREGPFETAVLKLAEATAAHVGLEAPITALDCVIDAGYTGAGYGVVGKLEREAIALMARYEGILLDPVYTGRAFGALVDLVCRKRFSRSETVLFWHTGGSPALFAYAADLAD
jgi:L-cysteate sulfo-lyase